MISFVVEYEEYIEKFYCGITFEVVVVEQLRHFGEGVPSIFYIKF